MFVSDKIFIISLFEKLQNVNLSYHVFVSIVGKIIYFEVIYVKNTSLAESLSSF